MSNILSEKIPNATCQNHQVEYRSNKITHPEFFNPSGTENSEIKSKTTIDFGSKDLLRLFKSMLFMGCCICCSLRLIRSIKDEMIENEEVAKLKMQIIDGNFNLAYRTLESIKEFLFESHNKSHHIFFYVDALAAKLCFVIGDYEGAKDILIQVKKKCQNSSNPDVNLLLYIEGMLSKIKNFFGSKNGEEEQNFCNLEAISFSKQENNISGRFDFYFNQFHRADDVIDSNCTIQIEERETDPLSMAISGYDNDQSLNESLDILFSILAVLPKEHISGRMIVYEYLGKIFIRTQSFDQAIKYFESLFEIYNKRIEHGFNFKMIMTTGFLGLSYRLKNFLAESLSFFNFGLELINRFEAQEHIYSSLIYENIATFYIDTDQNLAIQYFQSSLEIYERIDENRLEVAYCYNNIGVCCHNSQKYQAAVENFSRAIKIARDKSSIEAEKLSARILKNLGNAFCGMYDFLEARKNYAEYISITMKYEPEGSIEIINAYVPYIISQIRSENYIVAYDYLLAMDRLIKDQHDPENLVKTYNYLNFLFYLSLDQYPECEKYIEGMEWEDEMDLNLNLGILFLKQNKFEKAEKSLEIAKKIHHESKDANLKVGCIIYYLLANAYFNLQHFIKATLEIQEIIISLYKLNYDDTVIQEMKETIRICHEKKRSYIPRAVCV